MSCVYKGEIIESEQSANSKGGTELMRARLLKYVDSELLSKVAIHFSRPRELYDDVKNILYCHDLAQDPENKILKDGGWEKFDMFVFVSYWQRDQYTLMYGIPYSRCVVIPNAIELDYSPIEKPTDQIRFIYHTTPHRGLELVYPIFDELCKEFDNIHLDVYSSFKIYGWEQRDKPFEELFNKIANHDHMTYHGVEENETILKALRDSHIFLFPSIWPETSCLAMIEAVRSGVVVVHSSLGALPETSGNATIMYEYTEDVNNNANIAYSICKNILNAQKEDKEFFNRIMNSDRCELPKNGINNFSNSWNNILRHMLNG